jgi:hypothetical protein
MREADIFDFLQCCLEYKQSFVTRAKSDRKIVLPSGNSSSLFFCLKRTPVKEKMIIEIEGNSSKTAQSVDATVKYRKVELQVPKSNCSAEEAKKLRPITATLISD